MGEEGTLEYEKMVVLLDAWGCSVRMLMTASEEKKKNEEVQGDFITDDIRLPEWNGTFGR